MKIKNPLTAIRNSDSPRGLKLIAYSLLLVFVTALPMMAYVVFGPEDGNPMGLGLLFAGGAMVAHVGFLVGLSILLWDFYFRK